MKSAWAIAVLLGTSLLAGCGSTTIGVRGGAAATGASYNSAAVQVQGRPNAYFGAFFLGYVAAGVLDDYLHWGYGAAGRTPPLAEGRAVAERDCSLPMEAPSANLRCR